MTEETEQIDQNAKAGKAQQAPRGVEETTPPVQEAPVSESAGETSSPFAGQLDLVAGLAGITSRIVSSAASILEEKLATGIRVAQNIEKEVVDIEKARSRDSKEVIQRFRKDAHDMVDIVVDLVNSATKALDGLSERALTIGVGSEPRAEKKPAAVGIPSLAVPTAVKPGESVEIPMTLENESNKPTEAFNFHSSDLVNTAGERISSEQISFSPEQLVIEPQQASVVTVTIRVPENAAPGIYSGLLQATRVDQLRAVLSIQIV